MQYHGGGVCAGIGGLPNAVVKPHSPLNPKKISVFGNICCKLLHLLGSGKERIGTVSGSEDALAKAIEAACADAGISVSDIDAVSGFANGHKTIDELELSTYKKVFGRDIPVFAVRETIGEARAAAGAEQAAYAAKLLAGKLGSSAKAYIGGKAADVDVSGYKYVLAAAWGAGGSYSAVVLRKA